MQPNYGKSQPRKNAIVLPALRLFRR
jgi:hypothetical protein